MIKRLSILLVLGLAFFAAFAAEQEKFSIAVDGVKVIDLPFVLESYRVSAKGKIAVEEVSKRQLRVTGKAIGECNLSVSGGGVSKEYGISVTGNIGNILKRLRNDLDSLPELDFSINQDYIVIRGTVSNPANWELLQKTLPLYKENVHNFAEFRPSAETVLNLKKMLVEAGFSFCENDQPPEPGQLSLQVSRDAVSLSGELYSKASIDRVNQILATQTWLSLDGKPSAEKGQIRGIVNLTIIESVLQVDVVYVGISRNELQRIGDAKASQLGTLNLGGLYNLVSGRGSGTATFGGDMTATVSFLAQNGITRTYNAGHVSFANNDPKGGMLHTGGTVSVKVSGIESGSLQDIEYGLKIKVSGGTISASRVRLNLDLENTSYVTTSGDAYSRSVDSTSQAVTCELNKTIVVAGSRKISQDTQKSGLPILRNTPVLKWFVSGDDNVENETRLLILVCPRLEKFNPDVQISIPLENETASTYRDAKRDNNERIEEEKRYRGWLSWLNWFTW